MADTRFLILGAGPAALSALEEFRRSNSQDSVKMVNMEDNLPYSPAALPYLVSGKLKEQMLWLRDAKYFADQNCQFVQGLKAAKLDPDKKQVFYSDGSSDHYEKLLITVGADPIKPSVKGLEGEPQTFHVIEDCRKLISKLNGRKHVVVYGAGLIASELAVALIERGCQVTMIVRSRVLRAYFDEEFGDIIGGIMIKHGVQVISPVEIAEVKSSKAGVKVTLSDGKTVSGDIFVMCTGVAPKLGLVKGTSIKVNKGVVADRHMLTSANDVYVAGDMAEAFSCSTGKDEVIPILPNAVAQGKTAGAHMANGRGEYEGSISTNVFNFFKNSAFSAGLSTGAADGLEVFQEAYKDKGQFKKLVFSGDRLVGAAMLNMDVSPGTILYLIRRETLVGKVKEALFRNPREVSRGLMLTSQKETVAV